MIRWLCNNRMKEVSRLNLMYEWENDEVMEKRNKEALKKREQLLYYMGIKSVISSEGNTDKSIYYSKTSLFNIVEKTFNSKILRKLRKQQY